MLRREGWERRGEGRRKGKRKTGKQNCIRHFFSPDRGRGEKVKVIYEKKVARRGRKNSLDHIRKKRRAKKRCFCEQERKGGQGIGVPLIEKGSRVCMYVNVHPKGISDSTDRLRQVEIRRQWQKEVCQKNNSFGLLRLYPKNHHQQQGSPFPLPSIVICTLHVFRRF